MRKRLPDKLPLLPFGNSGKGNAEEDCGEGHNTIKDPQWHVVHV